MKRELSTAVIKMSSSRCTTKKKLIISKIDDQERERKKNKEKENEGERGGERYKKGM
jgi:hypothetical protein